MGFRRRVSPFAKLLAALHLSHCMSCLHPLPMLIFDSFWHCASSDSVALPARQRLFDFFALLCLTAASARGSLRHIGPQPLRFLAATKPLPTLVWLPGCRWLQEPLNLLSAATSTTSAGEPQSPWWRSQQTRWAGVRPSGPSGHVASSCTGEADEKVVSGAVDGR